MKLQKLSLSILFFTLFLSSNYCQIRTSVSNDKPSGSNGCNNYYDCSPCAHLTIGTTAYQQCFHQHQQLKAVNSTKENSLISIEHKKIIKNTISIRLKSLLAKYKIIISNN